MSVNFKKITLIAFNVLTAVCAVVSLVFVFILNGRINQLESKTGGESFDMKEAMGLIAEANSYVVSGEDTEAFLASIEDETLQAYVRQESAQNEMISYLSSDLATLHDWTFSFSETQNQNFSVISKALDQILNTLILDGWTCPDPSTVAYCYKEGPY